LRARSRRVRAASRAPRRTARGGRCRRCVRAADVFGAACGANDEAIVGLRECDGDGIV